MTQGERADCTQKGLGPGIKTTTFCSEATALATAPLTKEESVNIAVKDEQLLPIWELLYKYIFTH